MTKAPNQGKIQKKATNKPELKKIFFQKGKEIIFRIYKMQLYINVFLKGNSVVEKILK